MKLSEIKDRTEPFVVPMLKALLKGKKEVQLVMFNEDGTKTWMGKIFRIYENSKDLRGVMGYSWVLEVFTNVPVEYIYAGARLERSDIRQLARNRFESTVHALCIPASGNKSDLSETAETGPDGE